MSLQKPRFMVLQLGSHLPLDGYVKAFRRFPDRADSSIQQTIFEVVSLGIPKNSSHLI